MNERAVSQALSYTLTLGISTLLVVGLLTAGGNFVETQRNDVVDAELAVIGERLSADVATADRLVRVGENDTRVSVRSKLPRSVAGQSYTVDVATGGGNVSLALTATSLSRTVRTNVANATAIDSGAVAGGTLRIAYNQTSERLEVTDA